MSQGSFIYLAFVVSLSCTFDNSIVHCASVITNRNIKNLLGEVLTLRMQPTLLKPLFHRAQEQIGIFFSKNDELNLIIKNKRSQWSQTHKCWYLPLNEASYKTIREALQSKTSLDITALKAYLNKRKAVQSSLVAPDQKNSNKTIATSTVWELSKENLQALQKFVEQLKLKAYSTSTIKTYRNELLQLLQLLKKKPVHELFATHLLERELTFVLLRTFSDTSALKQQKSICI